MGFERLEYELTPDAIELGLDAALPALFELTGTIGYYSMLSMTANACELEAGPGAEALPK